MWVDGESKAARWVLPTRASSQHPRTPEQEAGGAWRDWAWTARQEPWRWWGVSLHNITEALGREKGLSKRCVWGNPSFCFPKFTLFPPALMSFLPIH